MTIDNEIREIERCIAEHGRDAFERAQASEAGAFAIDKDGNIIHTVNGKYRICGNVGAVYVPVSAGRVWLQCPCLEA